MGYVLNISNFKIIVKVVVVVVHIVISEYNNFFLFLVGHFPLLEDSVLSLCLFLNIVTFLYVEGFWQFPLSVY